MPAAPNSVKPTAPMATLRDNVPPPSWSYEAAFQRNVGIFTQAEQDSLRNCRVAIAGMGGVGGGHLINLVRLGIGRFTIADPDVFEAANFNRQYGATISNLGRNKATAMGTLARDINPELDLRVMPEAVDERNIDKFLDDADLFVDGLDFFALRPRLLAFREARDRGIWGITTGPHACSAACISFSPTGMTFNRYFDVDDNSSDAELIAAFAIGTVPALLHLPYLDLASYFSPGSKKAASLGAACSLASGVLAIESAKVLLGRGGVRPAPWYMQFDSYRHICRAGRLWFGNRGVLQQMRRKMLLKKIARSQ